jgi:hypothetical protein
MTAAWATAISAAETVETETSPIAWGVGTLVVFMLLLAMTLAFGRGRS